MNILNEISKWRQEKLIPEEYLNLLEFRYSNKYDNKNTNSRFTYIISSIGAILFSIGILTYMAANWEYFDKITKIIILLTSFLLIYIIGIYTDIKSLKNISLSFYFIASVFFGINIYFIAQLFNIQTYYPNGLLFWLIFIIPMIYITQSKLIFLLGYSLFIIWAFDQFIYNLILGLDKLINNYYNNNYLLLSFITLIGFIILSNIILSSLYFNKYKSNNFFLLSIYLSTIIIFAIIFFEIFVIFFTTITYNEISDYLLNPIVLIISQIPVITIFFIIFNILILTFFTYKNITIFYNYNKDIVLQVIVILILFLMITASILFINNYNIDILNILFSTKFLSNKLIDLIFKISYIISCILLINIGTKLKNNILVNIGIAFCAFMIIFTYFSMVYELLNSAIFFLGLGFIILLIGFLLDKYNKKLKTINE